MSLVTAHSVVVQSHSILLEDGLTGRFRAGDTAAADGWYFRLIRVATEREDHRSDVCPGCADGRFRSEADVLAVVAICPLCAAVTFQT
jgi:hypothetical protein